MIALVLRDLELRVLRLRLLLRLEVRHQCHKRNKLVWAVPSLVLARVFLDQVDDLKGGHLSLRQVERIRLQAYQEGRLTKITMKASLSL